MPRAICFHLDENVSHAVADGLRRRGIDTTTTPEAGLIAAPDSTQLDFARLQNRVLFTQDADFLRLHQTGISHLGIVYCFQGSCSIGDMIRGLVLIWELLDPEEMVNYIEFL